MEAYKELFRHKRNEEKRQAAISCFQAVWTAANIFGRKQGEKIQWNLTPHQNFLPRDLGAWMAQPIRINRLSQSPDPEADFMAQTNLAKNIDEFLQGIAANWRPAHSEEAEPMQEQEPETQPSSNPTNTQQIANHGREANIQPVQGSGNPRTNQMIQERTPLLPLTNREPILNENEEAPTERRKPTSRRKKKCIRRIKKTTTAPQTGEPSTSALRSLAADRALPPATSEGPSTASMNLNNQGNRGKENEPELAMQPRRHKVRCRFGPRPRAKPPPTPGNEGAPTSSHHQTPT